MRTKAVVWGIHASVILGLPALAAAQQVKGLPPPEGEVLPMEMPPPPDSGLCVLFEGRCDTPKDCEGAPCLGGRCALPSDIDCKSGDDCESKLCMGLGGPCMDGACPEPGVCIAALDMCGVPVGPPPDCQPGTPECMQPPDGCREGDPSCESGGELADGGVASDGEAKGDDSTPQSNADSDGDCSADGGCPAGAEGASGSESKDEAKPPQICSVGAPGAARGSVAGLLLMLGLGALVQKRRR